MPVPPMEQRVAAMSNRWDVRVASPRKLFRALHDFLDDRGYVHEYEPLKTERDAIDGCAVFKSELTGKMDSLRRNRAYLIFGIILLPTILLTTLGISFIRQSRYTLRTIVSVSVEGEAYLARDSKRGPVRSEVLDMVSDARVTLELKSGPAKGDAGIWTPSDDRREVTRLAGERQALEEGLSELLLGISQSETDNPSIPAGEKEQV